MEPQTASDTNYQHDCGQPVRSNVNESNQVLLDFLVGVTCHDTGHVDTNSEIGVQVDYRRCMDFDEPSVFPEDPVLAEFARALNDAGHWAVLYDTEFRSVYVTDEMRRTWAGFRGLAPVPIGHHCFSPESMAVYGHWTEAVRSNEFQRELFTQYFPEMLTATAGSRSALRDLTDPLFHDLVEQLPEGTSRHVSSHQYKDETEWGIQLGSRDTNFPVYDFDGRKAGFVAIVKPAVGMSTIGMIASVSDVRHLERIREIVSAERRPAAILFADLEASSLLARRMSTEDYFNLSRRLVRAADQCVVDAGGIVGRHLGDGVTAFFLAQNLGSESAAARASIEAARALRHAASDIAIKSDISPHEVVLRFGLHWGATLFVGLFKSVARSEVTAMGDEVNEASRIEACASGGKALASKSLIERLDRTDAHGLDLEHATYTLLGELDTATEKARRDAPAIPVTEI